MAYSDYPQGGSGTPPASDGGYGEYPSSEGGEGSGEEPEEHLIGDDGYLDNPKVRVVRRLKSVVLVVEVLVMFVLIFVAYQDKMAQYANLEKPPILPLQPILFVMLFMGVLMAITGIVFRALEMKYTESGSQRVLLANSAFRSALTSMVVAIIFLVIFIYVPTMEPVKDALSSKADENKGYGDFSYSFKSQDEFLVTRVYAVKMSTGTLPEHFVVAKRTVYDNFSAEYQRYLSGEHSQAYIENYAKENKIILVQNDTQMVLEGDNATSLPYGEYKAAVFVNTDETATIHYEVNRELQPELLSTLVTFLLIFAILDGVWMGVALAIKQRYKKDSIYT